MHFKSSTIQVHALIYLSIYFVCVHSAGVLVPWHPCGGRKTTSRGICYPTLLRQRLSLAVLVDVYSQLVAYELPGYSPTLFSQFTVWGSGITDVPLTLGFLN